MDRETQKQFKLSLEESNVPSFDYLTSFLEKMVRCFRIYDKFCIWSHSFKIEILQG